MNVVRNSKGLTLLEVLLTFTILATITAIVSPLIFNSINQYRQGIEKSSLLKEARLIENQLLKVTRNSKQPFFDGPITSSPKQTLYRFYSAEAPNVEYHFIFHHPHNTLIYKKVGSSNDRTSTLSRNIAEFELSQSGRKLNYLIVLEKNYNRLQDKKVSIDIENSIYFYNWD